MNINGVEMPNEPNDGKFRFNRSEIPKIWAPNEKTTIQWDKVYSTYKRTLYLINGRELTGYSKQIGKQERNDKIDLLTNWIIRDYEGGYLNDQSRDLRKSKLKEAIWWRIKDASKNEFEPIFTLKYNNVIWHSVIFYNNEVLRRRIERFYHLVRYGAPTEEFRRTLYVSGRGARTPEPLSLEWKKWPTRQELLAHLGSKEIQDFYGENEIQAFYQSYIEKYNLE